MEKLDKTSKTSRTKLADEMLNAGSGKTIKQPNVNDDKLTTITEMRQQQSGEPDLMLEDEQRIRPLVCGQGTGTKSRLPTRGRFLKSWPSLLRALRKCPR